MSNTVIDAVRQKYPQYKDTPDDQLTLAIGKKYPVYLNQDKDLASRFDKLSKVGTPPAWPDDEMDKISEWHPSLWEKFRNSDTGHKLLGPTPSEQQMISKGILAGPPNGDVGLVPLAAQLPMVMDAPEIAMAEKLPKVAKAAGLGTKALYSYWVAQFAAAQPEKYQEVKKQFETGDKKGAWKNILEDLAQGGFNAAIAAGVVKGFLPKPKTIGVPNASQNQKTAAVHGDVRSQPAPASGLPAQESGGGVQSPAKEVAKEAQVPLTKEQLGQAESFWSGATDNGKEKLLGDRSGSSKSWSDLTEDEQYRVATKAGIKPQTKATTPIEEVNLTSLDPEHQKMLDIERQNVDAPVEVLGEKELSEHSDDPFMAARNEAARRSIATIDRKTGKIILNGKLFSQWMSGIPKNLRQMAVRSLLGEERIHLATDDAAAKAYWGNLTGIEQAIVKRRYGADTPGMNDTLWGHEALRFRIQQLSRMTPREVAEAAGSEKWTIKGLTVLESAIRGVRETLGTKASRESKAMLDKVQQNLQLGKMVASGSSPGAVDKEVQDRAEKEAGELESQAKMYEESGDSESAAELRHQAETLRQKTSQQYFPMAALKDEPLPGEQMVTIRRPDGSTYQASFGGKFYEFPGRGRVPSIAKKLPDGRWTHGIPAQGETMQQGEFPGARPKKRQESVFQESFVLPYEETTKGAGMYRQEETVVPPEQRVSAEASGALPRLTGAEIERRGTAWVQDSINGALKASQEGKHPTPPKFNDFVDYMKKQEPKLQPGQLYEMWQKGVGSFLENAKGSQLREVAQSVFGRESMFGKSQIADKPEPGFKLEHPADQTAAERYQDERKAARTQSFREKAIGALYKRLVQTQLRNEALSANRKTITPSEVRYGAGLHQFDANAQNDPALGKMLVEGARASSDESPSVTKRVTVMQNKRTGQVEMVSTYDHPSKGPVLLDPLSPKGEHSPLDSILHRYRILASVPLDQPINKFRMSFKDLKDYNERFGNEARDNYNQETSYDPQQVPLSEFLEATPGRIEEGGGGMFQGPHRELVEEGSGSEFEKGETTPLTDTEASAIIDNAVEESGELSTPADIEASLTPEALGRNRQAMSGIAKLGRELGKEYPFASGDELKQKLADRIFQAHKDSKSLEDFQRKMGAVKAEPEPEKEAAGGRELVTMRSRAPTSTSKELPPQYFPMAALKTNVKEQAQKLDNDLFRLGTQYMADVEDAFPQVEQLIKTYEKDLPSWEIEKVYHKLDEEFTLGHSDIPLSKNAQKLYDQAANLFAENKDLYNQVKDINPDATRGYDVWSRMAKDVNSIFARVARGVKRGVTEGNLLSRSAWFTKRRVIKALVDDAGNRQVAVIKPDGKMVAYTKGKATDLGKFSHADTMRRHDQLEKELEPIDKEMRDLHFERNILTKTDARKATATRRIKNIDKRLAELYADAQATIANYPIDNLDDRVWQDKNGKTWKLAEATTREVESNMDVRFYKEPFSILMAQNLKLRQMLRSSAWLEQFKKSKDFQRIARKQDERNIPPDWKRTELPQLHGYVFEPHLADVLDQFHERSKGGDPNALTAMNRVLMNAVFFDNPFLHAPNLLSWWFTTRGALAWMNPVSYGRLIKTLPRAFSDVVEKSPDYVNFLRAGTPLQFTRMRDFSQNVIKLLQNQLEHPTIARKIANALGSGNPFKLWQWMGHASTAGLHDILTLQLIHEMQLKHPGMRPDQAMKAVTKIMPDYRVPARVLGSRNLSKMVTNPNMVWFGAYHYSEGKAFMNMAKGLATGKEMSRADALDKIAAIALLSYVAYPIIDDIVQKVTGQKDLAARRAGPTTWPSAIASVVRGERTPTQVAPSFVSPSAATTAAISLIYNTALGNHGLPIYNPRESLPKTAGDIGKFIGSQFNQGQLYRDITSGKSDWDTIWENMTGLRRDYSKEPSNQIYGWAYDWAKETGNKKLLKQFNDRAMEVYPPSKYAPLKSFLASGNMAKAAEEYRKLVAEGTRPQLIDNELKPQTHPLSGLKETEARFLDWIRQDPEKMRAYQEEMARRYSIYRNYQDMLAGR